MTGLSFEPKSNDPIVEHRANVDIIISVCVVICVSSGVDVDQMIGQMERCSRWSSQAMNVEYQILYRLAATRYIRLGKSWMRQDESDDLVGGRVNVGGGVPCSEIWVVEA